MIKRSVTVHAKEQPSTTKIVKPTSIKATSIKATSIKATSIKATSIKATSIKATSIEADPIKKLAQPVENAVEKVSLFKETRIINPGSTAPISLVDYSRQAMYHYGSYVIESRALADIRDGLKPVHRRILWSMYKLGLKSSGGYKKCARSVGDCFIAGTKVSIPTGTMNIEDFKIGDAVTTRFGTRQVTEIFKLPPQPVFEISLEDGKKITATSGQKFIVLRNGIEIWEELCNLTEGDKILTMG